MCERTETEEEIENLFLKRQARRLLSKRQERTSAGEDVEKKESWNLCTLLMTL